MFKLIALAVLALTVFATQDTPIPPTPDGYSLGSNTPVLHLEAFFDLLCPDSKASWGILEPILRNEYNIATNQTLRFTIHIFPLPYHINAFSVSQGVRVIADNLKNAGDVFTYFNLLFANQANYYTPATFQLNQTQVQQNLATLVSANMPDYASVFLNGLAYGNNQDGEARVSWKYGCSLGISGTPTFMANKVIIAGAEGFDADGWRSFLNGNYGASKGSRLHFQI